MLLRKVALSLHNPHTPDMNRRRCGVCTTYASGYFSVFWCFVFFLPSAWSAAALRINRPPNDAHWRGCRGGGVPGCCVSPYATSALLAEWKLTHFCLTAAATEAAAHAQSRSLHLQHPLRLTVCSPRAQARAKLAKLGALLRSPPQGYWCRFFCICHAVYHSCLSVMLEN